MKTIEYRTHDKSEWMRGEWDSEPDKRQWQDEVTGLPCLIVRNNGGSLCGYVGVTTDHPLHGEDYSSGKADSIEVHGGLTFASGCIHVDEPGDGKLDDVWWFGFDCAHYGDISPAYDSKAQESFIYRSYKSISYVEAEVSALAEQLAAMKELPK